MTSGRASTSGSASIGPSPPQREFVDENRPDRDDGGYQACRSSRAEPVMTSSHPLPAPCQWFSRLASALDRRSAPRLALLLLGAVLARGRQTVTSWIRATNLSDRFQSCYTAVAAAGKRSDRIARRLLTEVLTPLIGGAERLTLALDDTPTKRYGPHVQGAGVHHNPAPGPSGSPYVYGHVFVVLAILATHPAWGVIALPRGQAAGVAP